MAQENMDDAEGTPAPKKGKSKKLIIFVLLPLLLVVGIVAGAFFAGLFGSGDPKTDEAAPAAEGKPAAANGSGKPAGPVGPVFYDLDQIVVDLNSSGKRRSYLQMRLSLEMENPADLPIVQEKLPFIMDGFLSFLRELRLEDLQGTAGMFRIREELLIRVNQAAAPAKVQNILFKEILIQ